MTTASPELAASLFADAVAIADAVFGSVDDATLTLDPFALASSREDAVLHVQHLAAALRIGEHGPFDDHVVTAAGLFESNGGGRHELRDRLGVLVEVIGQRYGAAARSAAGSVVHGSMERLPDTGPRSISYIDAAGPSAELARRVLDALLEADQRRAVAMLLDRAAEDGDVSRLYHAVLTPCLREVGRLWQLGRVSVAQEHLVTSAVQLVMAQLYPRVFATPRRGLEVVVSTVEGELHAVGARMVADHFELAGWDTHFLGADLPTPDVASLVEKVEPDAVAVSVTLPSNVSHVAVAVEAMRAARPTAVVLVGGRPFDLVSDLWQVVGADGTASAAAAAIECATELVGAA